MKTNADQINQIKQKVCHLYYKEHLSINDICKQVDVGFVYVISWIHHYKVHHPEYGDKVNHPEDGRYLIF